MNYHFFSGVPAYWYPKYEREIRELLTVSEKLQTEARNYLMNISISHDTLKAQVESLKPGVSRKVTDSINRNADS